MNRDDGFQVDTLTHILGGAVYRYPGLWVRLGNLETRLLSDLLGDVQPRRPIYIAGLARSGSTLLLEMLAWHEEVVTHLYRDFPLLHVPYAWNRFLDRAPRREATPAERTHADGILVTPESPEAFEEVLWMTFFPRLHDPDASAVLDGRTRHPGFESFYRDHIRKLLLLRGGRRYVSKANYNVTRLEYLLRLFPDARFIIPVREPVWHIASLMKQHRLFCRGQRGNPRALTHLRRVGHYEFGLDRRPVNAGDADRVRAIRALWEGGNEVEGWALYWDHVHRFIADRLQRNRALNEAALIVRHERLCREPAATARAVLHHCRLAVPHGFEARTAKRVRFPTYYEPGFTEAELGIIERYTAETASRLGVVRAEDHRAAQGEGW